MKRILDGVTVRTKKKEITDFNIFEVEVGTTGFQGGDYGHGGRTYFALYDRASTAIKAMVKESRCGDKGVEIILGGDSELRTFLAALEYAVLELKRQIAANSNEK